MDSTQIYLAQLANENSAKQMNWQKDMSDTSHQREVADLKKAGLNPVLSSNSGAQSYTTSVDSAVNAIGNIESSKISSNAAIQAASISAQAQRDAAQKAYDAAVYSADHSKYGALVNAGKSVVAQAKKTIAAINGKKNLSKADTFIDYKNANVNNFTLTLKATNIAKTFLKSIGISASQKNIERFYKASYFGDEASLKWLGQHSAY